MLTIDEKRVYGDPKESVDAYVASETGTVRVRVAGGAVGEFALLDDRPARDVAAGDGRVAVATATDVLVGGVDEVDGDPPISETGFGPAVAVGTGPGSVLAAGPDGRVARLDGESWTELASLEEAPRAVDADLVASASGVYRRHGDDLVHAGLADVRDVSAGGTPLAATADGLYRLGNGWMRDREGSFDVVAADPRAGPTLDRAHAVAGETLYAYDPDADDWVVERSSDEPIVGVAYGETTYAVTVEGTMLGAESGDGACVTEWRAQPLGLADVRGLAVARRVDG